jgi:hypothetical protein
MLLKSDLRDEKKFLEWKKLNPEVHPFQFFKKTVEFLSRFLLGD